MYKEFANTTNRENDVFIITACVSFVSYWIK